MGTLLVLVVVAALSRNWIATVPNGQARRCLADYRFEAARKWLLVSECISWRNPQTELLRAKLARKVGRYEDARRHLVQAQKLGLAEHRSRREQALILARSGGVTQVVPHLPELLQQQDEDVREVCEAFVTGCVESRTQIRTAYELSTAWTADHPQDVRAYYLLARLCIIFQDQARAEKELRHVLELNSDHAAAAQALAELLLARQQPEAALRLFEQAAQADAESAELTLVQQARGLRLTGQSDQARQLLERELSRDAQSVSAQTELALWHLDQGQNQSALELLQRVLELDPHADDARYALATALRSVGRGEEAKQQFATVSQARTELSRASHLIRELLKDPRNKERRLEIGQIYLRFGSEAEGLAWLNSVLHLDPDHDATLLTMAEHFDTRPDPTGKSKEQAAEYRSRASFTSHKLFPASPSAAP